MSPGVFKEKYKKVYVYYRNQNPLILYRINNSQTAQLHKPYQDDVKLVP